MNSFYLEFSSSFFLVLKIFISLFFVFCCFFTEGGGGGIFVLYFIGQFLFLTLTLVSVSRVVVNTG